MTGTEPAPGLLVLAGTPIGHDEDATPRLAAELAAADVIATEDTRRLKRLLRVLDLTPRGRLVSYFEANESARTPDLVNELLGGARVVVVTDAGMPSVSDPGYRLVAAAVEAGVRVTAVPGPSAVLTALAVSGLPVDRFCFEGFLPRKGGGRASRLAELSSEPRTMVFFEAPHRLAASLADMAAAFGAERPAAVCRELTKTYEEIKRGGLADLAKWADEGEVRGEITVVVGGAVPGAGRELSGAELAELVFAREEAGGLRRKEAIAEVAAEVGLPKREVFDAVVAAKEALEQEAVERTEPSARPALQSVHPRSTAAIAPMSSSSEAAAFITKSTAASSSGVKSAPLTARTCGTRPTPAACCRRPAGGCAGSSAGSPLPWCAGPGTRLRRRPWCAAGVPPSRSGRRRGSGCSGRGRRR